MNRVVLSSASRMAISRACIKPQKQLSKLNHPVGQRKYLSTKSTTDAGKTAAEETEEARQKVLHEANETMKTYHDARMKKLRGELPSRQPQQEGTNRAQLAVLGFFLIGFLASPFIGKKIARDKEFREKYIPSWYDFTIKRPTSEMSREEVHNQILQLQKEIRARAIAGDFSDEKVAKMRRYMEGLDPEQNKEFNPDHDQHSWSKLHPGVEGDEDVEDE